MSITICEINLLIKEKENGGMSDGLAEFTRYHERPAE